MTPMLDLLDSIIDALRENAHALGVAPEAIVRGQLGEQPLRPPGVLVFLTPGQFAAVTAAGSSIDDPAFTVDLFALAAPAPDTAEAIADAYERALACALILQTFTPVWADDPITFEEVTSDFAAVRLSGLVYKR